MRKNDEAARHDKLVMLVDKMLASTPKLRAAWRCGIGTWRTGVNSSDIGWLPRLLRNPSSDPAPRGRPCR